MSDLKDIKWEVVSGTQMRTKAGEPCASIGYGRIALNGEACALINMDSCDWADIKIGRSPKGNVEKLAIEPLLNKSKTAFKIARRKKGDIIFPGANINSHKLVKQLFGETRPNVTRRFPVRQDPNKRFLIIELDKEIS